MIKNHDKKICSFGSLVLNMNIKRYCIRFYYYILLILFILITYYNK